MKTEKKERMFLGILGALLGSILGGAFIVFEGQSRSVFSIISGIVMAVLTLQGYAQLAGRQSKRGAVISLVIMAAMCALANQVNCTIELMEMVEPLQGSALRRSPPGIAGSWCCCTCSVWAAVSLSWYEPSESPRVRRRHSAGRRWTRCRRAGSRSRKRRSRNSRGLFIPSEKRG